MRRWLGLLVAISLCSGCFFSASAQGLANYRGGRLTPRREAGVVLAIAAAELAAGAGLMYLSFHVPSNQADDPPGSWSQGKESAKDFGGMLFFGSIGAALAAFGVGDTASGLLQLGSGRYVFETPEPED